MKRLFKDQRYCLSSWKWSWACQISQLHQSQAHTSICGEHPCKQLLQYCKWQIEITENTPICHSPSCIPRLWLEAAISNHMITKISWLCCWLRSLSNFNQPNLHNDSYIWCSLALSWQMLISTFTRKWPISQSVSCINDATWLHKHAEATTNLQKSRST